MSRQEEDVSTPLRQGKKGSCVDCDRPDSYDNFVQCDHCNGWWHMLCANVTDSIAEKPFSCRKCLPRSISSKTSSSISSDATAHLKLRLKQVEEQRNIAQRELEAERRAFEEEKKLMQEKYKLLRAELDDNASHRSHSHTSEQANLTHVMDWVSTQNALDRSEGGPERIREAAPTNHSKTDAPESQQIQDGSQLNSAAITSAIQAAVQAALKEVCNPKSKGVILKQPRKVVPPPVAADVRADTETRPKMLGTNMNHKGSNTQKGNVSNSPPLKPPGKPLVSDNYNVHCQDISKQLKALNVAQTYTGIAPVTGPAQPLSEHPESVNRNPNINRNENKTDCNDNDTSHITNKDRIKTQSNILANINDSVNLQSLSLSAPTPSQLAARQVMSRDLPIFSGDPVDWPIFVSSFVNSTVACGYNSAENLARLQRCLKGEAYEAVRSRLLLPDTVPQVLSTLQLLYGRPELLIGALLQKVRSVPTPKAEKMESLIEFGLAVQSLSDHLEAAGQNAHLSNPTLLMELVEKLPAHIKIQWATFMQGEAEVNLKSFSVFMTSIVVAASKVSGFSSGKMFVPEKTKVKQKGFINTHTLPQSSESRLKEEHKYSCCVCRKAGHRVADCSVFKSSSVDRRWKYVQNNRICRICLNSHGRRSCRNTNRCGINGCEYRHHPLLHSVREQRASIQQPQLTGANNLTHRLPTYSTLFRVVPVTLHGPSKTLTTFAFLDDGSSLTLIEDELVNELGVDGEIVPLCLNWTGNVTRVEAGSKCVELMISGIGCKKQMKLKGRTVQNLALDSQSMCYDDLKRRFKHLQGLPICSYVNALPRLIVGLDNLNLTVPLRIKEGDEQDPVAAKTRLGWCVYGGDSNQKTRNLLNVHSCACTSDQDLHETVKQYFALEEVGTKCVTTLESSEDSRARILLEQTTTRIGEKFETGLLWKFDDIELPDSYPLALKRLECLERRMAKDQNLKSKVQQLLLEYQKKGYATPATSDDLSEADPKRVWYLPLGVVLNPKKPTKVRLIWDAAAMVDRMSLNTFLLKGPDQLVSLPGILARFRQFAVGVTADIKEMFHQISIRKADRHSQRFLWREDPTQQPTIFLMNVATFGSTCSPASAQFVKNKNAQEFADNYPRAVQSIFKNHYVDDFLDSFGDMDEALRVSREVKMINSKAGFELKNWLSNKKEVLDAVGEANASDVKDLSVLKPSEGERVLGLLWETKTDVLHFPMALKQEVQKLIENNTRPTKRQMLRCLMSIFDPLGLLTVVLIHGRILLQDVWREGVQWDHMVSDGIWERWRKWIQAVKQIEHIRIPRCYFTDATSQAYQELELHIFVDASELAYAAVAFFRINSLKGGPRCSLVAAKAKVAPLKPLSVPRLELQAAVLGTRLMQFVIDNHTVTIARRYLWSDSATVLAWIRSDHRRYKQYVACRIGEILTVTDTNEWHWVPSRLNPADVATKWGKGPLCDVEGVWFKGPEFLRQPKSQWPQQLDVIQNNVCGEELRSSYTHREVFIPGVIPDYTRFSRWDRLLRTTAYAARFVHNVKAKIHGNTIKSGILTQEELHQAEASLMRYMQWQSYPDEVVKLKMGRDKGLQVEVDRTSILYTLCPLMDQHGVLRVDSRITVTRHVPSTLKFPIILPSKHYITTLIIDEYHRKFGHANFETVVNEIRQRFNISRLRAITKKVVKNCQRCKIMKVKPRVPRMAPLPPARLAVYMRPFSYVGLDYCGPFLVKVGRSSVKRWIALFTCLTIRAIHVEVAFSLTTAAFIKCFRRFRSRRGDPLEIYSDNGTNFRGAARLLEAQAIEGINRNLAATFTSTTTKWKFIPPATPHMGGAWERLVRSIKTAMYSAYEGDKKLNDEDFITLLAEAENIVNSRPLTYLPLESAESESLTPNHFIQPLRGSLDTDPELRGFEHPYEDFETTPQSDAALLGNTWSVLQKQVDVFWTRWIREYLPTLTRRTKWFAEQRPLSTGDLVLIVDGGARHEWIRGCVKEVLPGPDGRIRTAIVQTARGLMKRAISKLAILDVKGVGNGGKTETGGQYYGGESVVDRRHVTAP